MYQQLMVQNYEENPASHYWWNVQGRTDLQTWAVSIFPNFAIAEQKITEHQAKG